jgi:2-iminobutanoate/2-iminopropanoate deaminase
MEGAHVSSDPLWGLVYVSSLRPFDLKTGEIVEPPIERQTEIVLGQMKLCLEAA